MHRLLESKDAGTITALQILNVLGEKCQVRIHDFIMVMHNKWMAMQLFYDVQQQTIKNVLNRHIHRKTLTFLEFFEHFFF